MGDNFTAIFENKKNTNDFFSLPETIKTSNEFYSLRELTCCKDWKWMCEEDEVNNEMNVFGCVTMIGPCDIDITFGLQLIEVSHNTRWKEFIECEPMRLWLRQLCFSLSPVFGFPIYTSEYTQSTDFVIEGKNYNELLTHLTNNYGSIGTHISKDNFNYAYLERFEDKG
ncbi:hypothetical protein [Paenibacillus sp. 1P03SA]|uniref:hypothetical protein n=1 Tax=Paenibacillus sp. 1P03SA TaxID=3132294 RepID=UPI0039A3BB7E